MRLPFVGPAYQHRSVNVSAQRCVNLYPEMNEAPPGKEGDVAALLSAPGLRKKFELFSGAMRAMRVVSSGSIVWVRGNVIDMFAANLFAEQSYTGFTSDTGPVSIAENGQTVVLVDGERATSISLTTPFGVTTLTSQFDIVPSVVEFIDGYFIVNRPGTGQFAISGIYNTTFDSLDFATAEGSPDKLVTLVANNRELWLFGENSTEIWYNTGNADFPFERLQGAFIEYGCAAASSVAKCGGALLWLGQDRNGRGVVVQNNGFAPQRVSTHCIEQIIQSAGNIQDAVAYSYQQEGHLFYVLNFTAADTTLVYDLTTKLWHERAFWNSQVGTFERHLGQVHAHWLGEHLVGSYKTGTIYTFDPTAYSDDGAPLIRLRSAPHVSKELRLVYHNSFQLDVESGVGLDGGVIPGTDPQAMLRWSDDGGHTWSNERWISFGKIGEFARRALWRRLGRSRDRVYEVRVSDPVPLTILGATVDVAAGDS